MALYFNSSRVTPSKVTTDRNPVLSGFDLSSSYRTMAVDWSEADQKDSGDYRPFRQCSYIPAGTVQQGHMPTGTYFLSNRSGSSQTAFAFTHIPFGSNYYACTCAEDDFAFSGQMDYDVYRLDWSYSSLMSNTGAKTEM